MGSKNIYMKVGEKYYVVGLGYCQELTSKPEYFVEGEWADELFGRIKGLDKINFQDIYESFLIQPLGSVVTSTDIQHLFPGIKFVEGGVYTSKSGVVETLRKAGVYNLFMKEITIGDFIDLSEPKTIPFRYFNREGVETIVEVPSDVYDSFMDTLEGKA